MTYWPQFTYLALVCIGIGTSIANHGRERSNENCITTLIAASISLFLLYQGGFFGGLAR